MVLVLAAMMEELRVTLDLCSERTRLPSRGIRAYRGIRGRQAIYVLKTGIGPVRAGNTLERALQMLTPDQLLVTGYAGALDPSLKVGDLVVGSQAGMPESATSENRNSEGSLNSYPLADVEKLLHLGLSRGLTIHKGDVLTCNHLVGDPAAKRRWHEQCGASFVDMETAELARVAQCRDIPIACIRAITDEAEDDLLAPFSKKGDMGSIGRVARMLKAGRWRTRYEGWRAGAAAARSSLRQFLTYYFEFMGC
jgi:adenosylhomocysteine nucleosidase